NLPGADLRARQLRLSIQRWISGEADADYHETFAEFLHRVGEGIERVRDHRSAVVATSGGAIAATAACLLLPGARPSDVGPMWLRLNWVLTNASITRVRATDSALQLVSFNEHGHLVGNLRTHV
ncbi:MAG: histidine phosphatase family protein, partial [Nocardioides sp.]